MNTLDPLDTLGDCCIAPTQPPDDLGDFTPLNVCEEDDGGCVAFFSERETGFVWSHVQGPDRDEWFVYFPKDLLPY